MDGEIKDEQRIVFVGGAPRSGTTLMQRIIGAHQEVFAGPEFDFIPTEILGLRNKMLLSIQAGRISDITDEETVCQAFRNFIYTIFEERLKKAGKVVFSEKTPANALVFLDIEKLFPEARFIMMLRDPRDVVKSMKVVREKFIAKGQRPPRFVRSIAASVQEVNRYYEAGLLAAEQSDKILLVYYEDLVSDTSRQVRRVCEHIGLAYQPNMLKIDGRSSIGVGTGEQNWYSPSDLLRPIEPIGVVSRGYSLNRTEKALVERFTLEHRALARYQLQPRAPTWRESFLWQASLIHRLGLFLPRSRKVKDG